jgi:hypothetical protein
MGAYSAQVKTHFWIINVQQQTEPEFLNFEGTQESIPRNQFRLAVSGGGGPVRQPYSYSVPSPHRLFKNSSTGDTLGYQPLGPPHCGGLTMVRNLGDESGNREEDPLN